MGIGEAILTFLVEQDANLILFLRSEVATNILIETTQARASTN